MGGLSWKAMDEYESSTCAGSRKNFFDGPMTGAIPFRMRQNSVALPLTVGRETGLYSGFPMVKSNLPCP